MATAFLPGLIVLPARNDDRVGVAKRARDEHLLDLLEEADARGWSSSVSERSLALRRRRGPASSSCPLGCGWVAIAAATATAEEHGCRPEVAAAIGVGEGDGAEEKATVDPPCFHAYRSACDSAPAAFDPPPMAPMADPLLPLCAFVTDAMRFRDGDHLPAFDPPPMATPLLPVCSFIADFVKARNRDDEGAAKRPRDGDVPALSEEAAARGWSSSQVPERSLAPRRRRGLASISTRRG